MPPTSARAILVYNYAIDYYDHSNGALHEYLAHGLDRLLIDLYASISRIIRILSYSIITLVSRARFT